MQTLKDLKEKFYNDSNAISLTFLENYALRFDKDFEHLSEPLLRWQDFVLRYIPPKPRGLFFSKEIIEKLSLTDMDSLKKLIFMMQNGEDVNSCQSTGLTINNDISSNRRDKRTDGLWAEWGIHHLHVEINKSKPTDYYTKRSDWLLFIMVFDESILLIDIKSHQEALKFSDPELLSIIYKNWPSVLSPYEIKGVLPPKKNWTKSEVGKLRRGGVSTYFTIDGKVFVGPNMGVTTASTPAVVTLTRNKIIDACSFLAEMAFNSAGQFKKEMAIKGILNPMFCLSLTPKGLAVYELKANVAFVLPKHERVNEKNHITFLNEHLAPEWAVKKINSNFKGE